MSELKAIFATPHPKMKNACDGAVEVYLKSEAYKVIAELKDKLRHYPMMAALIDSGNKELRHHKYKRCLAMASKCRLRARWFGDNSFYKKEQWALQWRKRWLELAEVYRDRR